MLFEAAPECLWNPLYVGEYCHGSVVRLLPLCSRSGLGDFRPERERVALRDEGRGQVLLLTHLTVGYFCYSQSKHGNLIIPEGEWKQASIDILVSKTKDRRKTRSERSWRSARLSPDGRELWACAGLSSCPAGSYRCIYCIKHRFSIALDYYLHRGMALGWAMPRNRMAIASKPASHIDSRLRISKYT